ncbi:glycosyltransferase [Lactiplantibacillus plantarum]|uniref:glycosyltransferase n=1 Tax=Lactiplantibacillus plantarum TaxID=1590 RepID=UPI00189E874E|nr:glycosyltransferase [Lactiplantibacillus plantarum]MDB7773256.1 glycosyltransferase [Lactiplantibacillus plantarum]
MIKVLQLCDSIEKRDGRMSVIMNIYRNIDRGKIQFDFACTDYGFENFEKEIKKLGGKIFLLPKNESSMRNIKKLVSKLLSVGQYDFVHYHAISKWGCALSIAHKYHVKTIAHSHATKLSDSFFKSIRNRLFSLNILSKADYRVAVSPEAGKKLFMYQSFKYIPNIIDYNKFIFSEHNREYIRNFLGVSSSEVLIGLIGRISKQKNQKYAMRILNKLFKMGGTNYKIVFIGDDDSNNNCRISSLKGLSKKYSLSSQVIFTGMVSNTSKYYSALDLLWIPSLYEGLPTVGVEAQANGLHILASNKLSRSLNFTGNVEFLSISRFSLSNWVSRSLKENSKRDNVPIIKIRNSEYNLTNVMKKWCQLYGISNDNS